MKRRKADYSWMEPQAMREMTPREKIAEARLRRIRQVRFNYGEHDEERLDRILRTVQARLQPYNEERRQIILNNRYPAWRD